MPTKINLRTLFVGMVFLLFIFFVASSTYYDFQNNKVLKLNTKTLKHNEAMLDSIKTIKLQLLQIDKR
jgi:hypothetical protein